MTQIKQSVHFTYILPAEYCMVEKNCRALCHGRSRPSRSPSSFRSGVERNVCGSKSKYSANTIACTREEINGANKGADIRVLLIDGVNPRGRP